MHGKFLIKAFLQIFKSALKKINLRLKYKRYTDFPVCVLDWPRVTKVKKYSRL